MTPLSLTVDRGPDTTLDRNQREVRMNAKHDRDDPVARRAYELFETRGREEGHDLDDWLQAEREVQERPVPSGNARRRPRRDEERSPDSGA